MKDSQSCARRSAQGKGSRESVEPSGRQNVRQVDIGRRSNSRSRASTLVNWTALWDNRKTCKINLRFFCALVCELEKLKTTYPSSANSILSTSFLDLKKVRKRFLNQTAQCMVFNLCGIRHEEQVVVCQSNSTGQLDAVH